MKSPKNLILILLAAALLAGGAASALVIHDLDSKRDSALDLAERLSQELEAARQDLDGAIAKTEQLNGELDLAQERLEGLDSDLEEVGAELAGRDAQIADLQTKLQEAEAKANWPQFDPEGPDYQDILPDFYAPQPLNASVVRENVVYLTFDDGPSPRTREVLAALAKEDVKATFFVVGRSAKADPDTLRAIADAGHTVAMHSYSHEYKQIYASVQAFLEDMYKCFQVIRDTTGVAPTYFRFPGGSVNSYNYGIYQDITAEMLRRGFIPCDWNMSAQDATKTPLPVDTVISNVLASSGKPYGVVLMHDSSARTTTVQALPGLIAALRDRGFTFDRLTPEIKPVTFNYRKIQ